MEVKIDLPFQHLLNIVKSLTPEQKRTIRNELEAKQSSSELKDEFLTLLLNGPVYSEQEIGVIEENRKSINAWRTKN
jgi:hypothetical protein